MSGLSGTDSPSDLEGGGRALKLQTDTPHLVNIGGDRLSTSVTLHPIPQGRVTLGCGPGVDIRVQGTGVLPLHCHIENSEGVVTIYPLCDNISIDGIQIATPTRLSQGVMLTIGRSNYMRFNHPAEAKLMKSVLPNPRISMAAITFEPDNVLQPKFNKKPPAVPRKNSKESLIESGVEEPVPSSIMTKVSKFEFLAQQNFKKTISPKVFSANLVTVNTPAKDVLGKSPPDLKSFSKNLPQNALNYSELNSNEKHQMKTPDRSMFGKKSPQYVNVAVNEKNNVNNKVIIYENGCIPKSQNTIELNNKNSTNSKNNNLNRAMTPSPNYNRNPSPHFRSMTPSPVSNTSKIEHRRSGSVGELESYFDSENSLQRQNNDEMRRAQAQQDRIKEQEIGKAEQARLEEILNMCVEYEKQAQCEKNKVTPNRIKTNGSLPRDKRQYMYTTPPPSPADWNLNDKKNNHSYENVSINRNTSLEGLNISYENVEIRHFEEYRTPKCSSPYENIVQHGSVSVPAHQSPRTRIKTIASSNRDGCSKTKDTAEIIENKFAILEAEQYLLQNLSVDEEKTSDPNKTVDKKNHDMKFIFPLDETAVVPPQTVTIDNTNYIQNVKSPTISKLDNNITVKNDKLRIEKIKKDRKELLARISSVKRNIADTEILEEELQREMDLEHALLSGEHKSKLLEIDKLQARKDKLLNYAQKLEESMSYRQSKQEEDQLKCKEKLEIAQTNMNKIEKELSQTPKTDPGYEDVFEEYLKAQEILDNERKVFEDLEFHHLEEEADWLASREEVQREILDLTTRIEATTDQTHDLEQQKYNLSKNNTSEVTVIKKRRHEYLKQLEKLTTLLKSIDNDLSIYANQESDPDETSDSDSDKSKDLDKQMSNLSLIHDLSCSVIISNTKSSVEHISNMSQSFNEKLLQEKSVLETGIGNKCPSQDDIDRISKVTSGAPINISEEQGSLGRKTIESLKDIERRRHLHLCQQGSQVIEQERQRVLALKQRVQQEVLSKWAQNRQDSNSLGSSGSEEKRLSREADDHKIERPVSKSPISNEQARPVSDGADSSRPLSEVSEISMEYGNVGKKRGRTHSDKQRPLTRYLPIRGSDLDLRQHIESAGHQVVLCPHVIITSSSCRGFLHKKGSKLNGWSKRWFVFDRIKHTFTYYNNKSEKKPRGGAYFQAIEEVYLDHLNTVKSPNPQLTFIVKTHERSYYLMAPSPEAMRIWMDVIFTGAEGYLAFEHGT